MKSEGIFEVRSVAKEILAFLAVAGGVVVAGPTQPAVAHPVTELVYRVAFPFSGKLVKAVDEAWTMDEGTSAQIISTYDKDKNGQFDKAEIAQMGADILGNLAASRYLSFIDVDGRSVDRLKPFGFRAFLSGTTVILAFGLRLPQPVDPSQTPLSLTVKDPDFVMDIEPARAHLVVLKDAPSEACATRVSAASADTYPRYALAPKIITLSCPTGAAQ